MGQMNVLFTPVPQALQTFDTSSGEIYPSLLADRSAAGMVRIDWLFARSHDSVRDGWGIWGGNYNFAGVGMALDGAPGMTALIRSPHVHKSGGLSTVSSEYELGGGWTIGELSVVRGFRQSRP